MHPRTAALVAISGILLTACRQRSTTAGAVVERDSAGLRIVENARPAWRDGGGWRLADTPSADIGGAGAPPQEQLEDVVSVARTELGVIAAVNAATQEIRLFSRTGRFIRSLGGRAGAPGFTGLVWTAAAGDSIVGYDIATHQLTMFGIPGVRTVRFQASGPFTVPLARFHDGGLLMAIRGGTFPFTGAPGEIRADSALVVRFAADGALRDTVGRFAWGETFGVPLGPPGATFLAPFPRPLAPRGSAAISGGRVVVGTGVRYELAVHGADGRLQRIVRRVHRMIPVTPETEAAWRAAIRLRAPAESLVAYPATLPAYERVIADEDGFLWILEAEAVPVQSQRWSIFDPDGRWMGMLTMPAGFRLEAAGRDEVVGLWRDESGAEHLRVYRLQRTQ